MSNRSSSPDSGHIFSNAIPPPPWLDEPYHHEETQVTASTLSSSWWYDSTNLDLGQSWDQGPANFFNFPPYTFPMPEAPDSVEREGGSGIKSEELATNNAPATLPMEVDNDFNGVLVFCPP